MYAALSKIKQVDIFKTLLTRASDKLKSSYVVMEDIKNDVEWSGHVSDEELFEQFMLATNFDLNYDILIDNPLAF